MRSVQWRIYNGGESGGELAGRTVRSEFWEINSSNDASAQRFTSVCEEDGWSIWAVICSSFSCNDFISVLQQSSGAVASSQPQELSLGKIGSIWTEVIFPLQKCVATVIPTVRTKYMKRNNMTAVFFILYNSNVLHIGFVPTLLIYCKYGGNQTIDHLFPMQQKNR